jgi:hypothetical protein
MYERKSIKSPPLRDCVVIIESAGKIVIPAKAGIQNLLETLGPVSRFACTEWHSMKL